MGMYTNDSRIESFLHNGAMGGGVLKLLKLRGYAYPTFMDMDISKNEIRREESSSREDSKSDPANLIARKGVISFYHHRLT